MCLAGNDAGFDCGLLKNDLRDNSGLRSRGRGSIGKVITSCSRSGPESARELRPLRSDGWSY